MMFKRLLTLDLVRALRMALAAIAALGAILSMPAMAAGKKVALIIGNSNYVNGGVLPNPGNDADKVFAAAQRAGFDAHKVTNLGRADFIRVLREFRDKADSAEVALLYYAGHAIEKDGVNWLLPVDGRLADPRDLRDEAVELTSLLENLSGAERRVILLDACRNNPFKEKWTSATRSFQNGLGGITPTDNSLVIFAASAGATTPDGDAGGNSNFAKALETRLVEPGLALQDLGPAISDDVRKMSGGIQRPFTNSTLGSIKYFLIPKPDAISVSGLSEDDIAWARAQKLRSADGYRDYIRNNPNGAHVGSAMEFISFMNEMRRAAPPSVAPAAVASAPTAVPAPTAMTTASAPVATPSLPAPSPQVAQPVQLAAPPVVSAPVPAPSLPAPSPQLAAPAPAAAQPSILAPARATAAAPGLINVYNREIRYTTAPALPEPPLFQMAGFPACREKWQTVTDPVGRVEEVNRCRREYGQYKQSVLNGFRVSMNNHLADTGNMYNEKIAPDTGYSDEARKSFYDAMIQRSRDGQDGGRLMKDYEAAIAKWNEDFKYLEDRYCFTSGTCGGYPTPAGLAPVAK